MKKKKLDPEFVLEELNSRFFHYNAHYHPETDEDGEHQSKLLYTRRFTAPDLNEACLQVTDRVMEVLYRDPTIFTPVKYHYPQEDGDIRDLVVTFFDNLYVGFKVQGYSSTVTSNFLAERSGILTEPDSYYFAWTGQSPNDSLRDTAKRIRAELSDLSGTAWQEACPDPETAIFKPLLSAVRAELLAQPQAAANLIAWLLKPEDLYLIRYRESAEIPSVSVYYLGFSDGCVKMPDALIDARFKISSSGPSDNTLELIFTNGWTAELRARTVGAKVRPSAVRFRLTVGMLPAGTLLLD